MFKNLALVLAIVIFGFCFYTLYLEKTPAFKAYCDRYEVYLTSGSFGNNIAISTDTTFGLYKSVKGESCKVSVPYSRVLTDFSAKHLFSESVEGGTNHYAYSPKLGYRVYINGFAVNLHYFESQTGSDNKLGTPVIYGSF